MKNKKEFAYHTLLALLECALLMAPVVALADNTLESGTSWVKSLFTPGFLIGILTLALAACGLAWYFGKMTAEWALRIVGGSVILFGAPAIAMKLYAAFASGWG